MNSLLDEQLALSGHLQQQSLTELSALLKQRPVAKLTASSSFFELAQELLNEKSIQQALRLISWENALTLSAASEDTTATKQFLELALAHPDLGIYPTVLKLVQKQTTPPPLTELSSQLIEIETDAEAKTHSAAAAFNASSSLSELLWRMKSEPIPRNANGTLHMAERRRLRDAGFGDGNHFPTALLRTALGADLILDEAEWVLSKQGLAWLQKNKLQRWEQIRDSLLKQLGAKLSLDGKLLSPELWPNLFPWDPEWERQSSIWQSELIQWGLLSANNKLNPWVTEISDIEQRSAHEQTLHSHFPAEVQQVYLQQDLSVIAPGTLAATIDFRLRTMSLSSASSQASSYQISARTLAHAMTFSEPPEQIRSFLNEISIHPLPQPLAFELAELGAKYLTLKLSLLDGETSLESDDPALLSAIESNPDLSQLGWRRHSETTLQSAWPLRDAARVLAHNRIPVRLEADSEQNELSHEISQTPQDSKTEQLLSTMIDNRPEPGSLRWLQELLDPLVRNRESVLVKLLSSQGEKLEFQIELRGISAQRIRGVDHSVASERTVPLNAITHIYKGDHCLFQP